MAGPLCLLPDLFYWEMLVSLEWICQSICCTPAASYFLVNLCWLNKKIEGQFDPYTLFLLLTSMFSSSFTFLQPIYTLYPLWFGRWLQSRLLYAYWKNRQVSYACSHYYVLYLVKFLFLLFIVLCTQWNKND